MKKSNAIKVLFSLLLIASLASYVFLAVIAPREVEFSAAETEELLEEEIPSISLPDVEVVKKVLDVSKLLLRPTGD